MNLSDPNTQLIIGAVGLVILLILWKKRSSAASGSAASGNQPTRPIIQPAASPETRGNTMPVYHPDMLAMAMDPMAVLSTVVAREHVRQAEQRHMEIIRASIMGSTPPPSNVPNPAPNPVVIPEPVGAVPAATPGATATNPNVTKR